MSGKPQIISNETTYTHASVCEIYRYSKNRNGDDTVLQINLKTHTVKNGNKVLMKNGIPKHGFTLSTEPISFQKIEELYQIYKHSVPDDVHRKTYFKALAYEEMTDHDLTYGANREKSRTDLELTLLAGILNGSLTWPDATKWFWQSETDKDLVLLREWFIS